MSNEIQNKIVTQLNEAMHMESKEVLHGAIGIKTPFLDWKGYPVTIYVTATGRVTDGGNTLKELRALRVIEKFKNWKFKEDYYQRYGIKTGIGDELEPADIAHLLSYVQGITRLGFFFPLVHPLHPLI